MERRRCTSLYHKGITKNSGERNCKGKPEIGPLST